MEEGGAKDDTVFDRLLPIFNISQLDFNLAVHPHFFQHPCEYHRHHPTLRIIIMQFHTVSIKATRFVIIVPHFFFLSVYTILKFLEIFENATKLVLSLSPKSNTNQS